MEAMFTNDANRHVFGTGATVPGEMDGTSGHVPRQKPLPRAPHLLPVKNLTDIIGEIEAHLDEKDEVRELALKSSRAIARLSGAAIHGLHKGADSEGPLREAREEAMKLRSVLEDQPDLFHSGFVENALQELCEASIIHAIAHGKPLPSPKECAATDA